MVAGVGRSGFGRAGRRPGRPPGRLGAGRSSPLSSLPAHLSGGAVRDLVSSSEFGTSSRSAARGCCLAAPLGRRGSASVSRLAADHPLCGWRGRRSCVSQAAIGGSRRFPPVVSSDAGTERSSEFDGSASDDVVLSSEARERRREIRQGKRPVVSSVGQSSGLVDNSLRAPPVLNLGFSSVAARSAPPVLDLGSSPVCARSAPPVQNLGSSSVAARFAPPVVNANLGSSSVPTRFNLEFSAVHFLLESNEKDRCFLNALTRIR